MATGLPVISTDFPTGVAKEVVKEKNGIVIPMKDEQALIDAISSLLSDEELRRSMSIENRKILNELVEKSVVALWEKLF